MKKSQIKIGGIYVAKVSNKLVNVRVNSIETVPSYGDRTTTRYGVTNLATGRQTSFRSATKFRGEVPNLMTGRQLSFHLATKFRSEPANASYSSYIGWINKCGDIFCKRYEDESQTSSQAIKADPDNVKMAFVRATSQEDARRKFVEAWQTPVGSNDYEDCHSL
jgi:hypothetical protein